MDLLKSVRVNKLIDLYGKLLTEKQLSIVTDYYINDLSLGEIADIHGITRQAVNYTINLALKSLEGYEQKLEYLNKIGLIKQQSKDLSVEQQKIVNNILDILEG